MRIACATLARLFSALAASECSLWRPIDSERDTRRFRKVAKKQSSDAEIARKTIKMLESCARLTGLDKPTVGAVLWRGMAKPSGFGEY